MGQVIRTVSRDLNPERDLSELIYLFQTLGYSRARAYQRVCQIAPELIRLVSQIEANQESEIVANQR
ncbi:hypothetical protein KQ940_01665 [Marinobacterium sp. D7]|uniref:hypothetical protein n=1 Tax=Marinobacterium ramblicola TaxID=2849041 RepID=UPI001C2D1DF2|nr:hypothetical protein [Marinobacterium ramblicola]MBV1786759.1 hypothetical protein [Marinobacterium ramblicola]